MSGLGVHAPVLYAIADRLAQPEGAWRRFAPPAAFRAFYPAPAASAAHAT